MSPALLAGAAVVGLLTALTLHGGLGLNVLLAGVAVLAVVFPVARRNRTALVFAALAVALLVLPVLVDAGWIAVLAILLAVPLASYALTGGRSWIDLVGGGLALPLAVPYSLTWAVRGLTTLARSRRGVNTSMLISLSITGMLLLTFGVLFATADAAFSDAVTGLIPEFSVGSVFVRILVFGLFAAITLAGAFFAIARPRFKRPPAAPEVGRIPWAVPIVALDLLFLAFVAVQAKVFLASDRNRVLRSTGLSYAQYARQGFWQLLIVTGLVIAILALAVYYAPLRGGTDRIVVRALLGLLCALTLVIVVVALRRLYLYEEAYGWTRLRLWVHAVELWLGLVIVLIAIAGIRLEAAWLPRVVAMSGAVSMLALGLLNPDGYIAARNVDHFHKTGKLDTAYLQSLSADAVPALDDLPEPQRTEVLAGIAHGVKGGDSWTSYNVSRARARALLRRHPLGR